MSDGTFSDLFLFFLSPVQLQQHVAVYDTPDDHKRQHRTIRHIHLYVTHKCRPVERQQMPDQLFVEDEVLQSPGIESHKKEKQAEPTSPYPTPIFLKKQLFYTLSWAASSTSFSNRAR